MGYLCRRTGRPAEALEWLERAHAARPEPWAPTLELGWMLATGRDPERGARLLAEAREHFQRMGDLWGLASALTHLGTLAVARSELARAVPLLEEAAALKARCGDLLGEVTAWHHLGVVALSRCEHHLARSRCERALTLARRAGFRQGIVAALNALGSCHLETGDGTQARRAFLEARRLVADQGPARGAELGVLELNLGHAETLAGCWRPAITHLRRAVELLAEAGAPASHRAGAVANLAQALVGSGDHGQAMAVVEAQVGRLDAAGAQAQVELLTVEARAATALCQPDRAVAAARRATALAGRAGVGSHALVLPAIHARATLAEALAGAGQRAAARREWQAAGRQIARALDRQPVPSLRIGLLETCHAIADGWIEFLAADGPAGERQAFSVARSLKARELDRGADPRGTTSAASTARDLEARIRSLVVSQDPSRDEKRLLARLQREYRTLVGWRTESARPGASAADWLAALDLPAIEPFAALVEYHVAREATFAFVVHGSRLRVLRLPVGAQRLARVVERLTAPLRNALQSLDPMSHLLSFDAELPARLGRLLLQPVLDALPARPRRLWIVPSGPLHLMPFDLLEVRASAGGADGPVVDAFEIASLASSMPAPRRRAGPRSRVRPAVSLAHSPAGPLPLQTTSGQRLLAPLPEAEREARAVAAAWPAGLALTGPLATAAAFRAESGGARLLHVAAHAVADPLSWELSGLLVAGTEGENTEWLPAAEIARLELTASLVTLSACDTAVGRVRRSEGVMSLAWAFMLAGAEAVLATRWPIDDAAALAFSVTVSRGLRKGLQPVEAVARARRLLRAGHDWNGHPVHWAAWQLIHARPPRPARR